jgi:four helix bundle protein
MVGGSQMEWGFEKLNVYQLSLEFVDSVFTLAKSFTRGVQSSLGDQLRRAALSIPSNIAEGSGQPSKREKKRFYNYAFNSASECIPILSVARSQGEVIDEDYDRLRETCSCIHRMLIKLIKSVDPEPTQNPKPKTRNRKLYNGS